MYPSCFQNDEHLNKIEVKLAKEVKTLVAKGLPFMTVWNIFSKKLTQHTLKSIQSIAYDVHTFHQPKISLSPFESKRHLTDIVHSLQYGHYKLDSDKKVLLNCQQQLVKKKKKIRKQCEPLQ